MKKIKKIGLFILLVFLSIPNVYAGNNLKCVSCGDANQLPAPVPKLTSIAFALLIVAVPLILIAFSIVALVKATMAGKADEIMKAKSKLIKKVIATVIIFLVAGIVQFVMVKAGDASERQTILNCMNCLLYGECEEVECSYNDTDRDSATSNSQATGSNRRPNSNSNSSSNGGTVPSGNFSHKGKTYALTDTQALKIAALAVGEEGGGVKNVHFYASFCANLAERKNIPVATIYTSSWFSSGTRTMAANCNSVGCDVRGHKVTQEEVDAVKDAIVNGNRDTYADDHDCFGDIVSITVNGKTYNNTQEAINSQCRKASAPEITNKANYISGETVIKNRYGGTYVFEQFPPNGGDPFGRKK